MDMDVKGEETAGDEEEEEEETEQGEYATNMAEIAFAGDEKEKKAVKARIESDKMRTRSPFLFIGKTDERLKRGKSVLMDNMSEEQQDRFSTFRRTRFEPKTVKRVNFVVSSRVSLVPCSDGVWGEKTKDHGVAHHGSSE